MVNMRKTIMHLGDSLHEIHQRDEASVAERNEA